jgi:hypothetical protein
MTLQQQETELEVLDQEADALAVFFASFDTGRLHMIGTVIGNELAQRYEGKPCDKGSLH